VSRFTRELEADVPQIVAAMHVAGIGEGEVSCSVAHADFFHDNVRAVAGSGDEEPGVKGPQLIAGAVPTDVGVRDELGDLAGDLEAECFPVEGNMGAELARGVVALCANRSAWAGSKPSGQRISTERSMRSSWMVVMRHILVALAGCPTAAQ
jgi:hypothetical protein